MCRPSGRTSIISWIIPQVSYRWTRIDQRSPEHCCLVFRNNAIWAWAQKLEEFPCSQGKGFPRLLHADTSSEDSMLLLGVVMEISEWLKDRHKHPHTLCNQSLNRRTAIQIFPSLPLVACCPHTRSVGVKEPAFSPVNVKDSRVFEKNNSATANRFIAPTRVSIWVSKARLEKESIANVA